MLADVAEQAEAIELGHVQVNNGKRKIVFGNAVTGGFAILGRCGLVAEIGKQAGEYIADERIIIDNQNTFACRSFGPLADIVFGFHETLPTIFKKQYRGGY